MRALGDFSMGSYDDVMGCLWDLMDVLCGIV